jgi:hypothetical protein
MWWLLMAGKLDVPIGQCTNATTYYMAYDSGGGWRQERDTTPKARGGNEQRVHGGRLERARVHAGHHEQEERHKEQSPAVRRGTVNDTVK